MKQKTLKLLSFYSTYLALLFFYIAVYLAGSLFLHIDINRWTLASGFLSYNLLYVVALLTKHKLKMNGVIKVTGALAVTACLFWLTTLLFSHTYDISYDGQQYQQTAVIALGGNWNPIYQPSFSIKGVNAFTGELILGNPKTIWSIDASIYKLTGKINAATTINLFAGLLAFLFCLLALTRLGARTGRAVTLAVLAVLSQPVIDQIFSFRQDGISYEFLLVGIASMMLAVKSNQKLLYFMCIAGSITILIGSKFTNAFVLLPFGFLLALVSIKHRWFKLRSFWLGWVILIVASCMTLFSPYITNIERYSAVDYPYNLTSIAQFSHIDNTPYNLHHANRMELFIYGIFAAADNNNSLLKSSTAHLKIPFMLSANELTAYADPSAMLSGGYGPYFGGIILLSIICYLYMAIRPKTDQQKVCFKWLSLALLLIIASCLLNPVPNYARYNAALALAPVAIAAALVVGSKGKKSKTDNLIYRVLAFWMIVNTSLALIACLVFQFDSFSSLDQQLSQLRETDATYEVYANSFYSNYLLLEEANVKIRISPSGLNCRTKLIYLDQSRNTTELCRP